MCGRGVSAPIRSNTLGSISMRIYTIYTITNQLNGKTYVGFTSNKPNRRWKDHKKPHTLETSQQYIHRAMRKYGVENFKFQPIYQSTDQQYTLKNMEPHFIFERNSHVSKHGYNLTNGGDGTIGRRCSEETRRKIGKASADRIHTSESKARISNTLKESGNTKRCYNILWDDGALETITGLYEFCESRNLSAEMLYKVANGAVKSHRGVIGVERINRSS